MATPLVENFFNTPTAERLIKKHQDRISLVENLHKSRGKDLTFEKKLALATTLENTQKQIRVMESMEGATQPAHIGQYKRYALDMVAAVVPNLIAYDIVSVQPIDNRVGMINYLQFSYGSTKGNVDRGQVFASTLAYQGSHQDYTSDLVDGEVLTEPDQNLKAEGALSYTPIRPGTVQIVADGQVLGVDNGQNAIAGDGIATGTIDYESGNYSITLAAAIQGDLTATYNYDNESVPVKAPQLQMSIKSLPVITKSRKLTALYAFDSAYELQKEYGQDIQQLLAGQASAEIAYEIDNEITTDLYRIATAAPELTWSKVAPVGVNMIDHYDSFYNKIVEGSNIIFGLTKRVRANFMVCGLGVDAVLKTMRNFDSANDTTSVGPHFTGTLGGTIRCYVNPNYDPNAFVLGYKGNNTLDAGYFYCPYMPITTTQMVMLDDFAGRQGWATTYGKKAVNPRLYLRGRITG